MIMQVFVAVTLTQAPADSFYDDMPQDGIAANFASSSYFQSIMYSAGSKKLSLTRGEREDNTADLQRSYGNYGARYRITCVTSREGGRILYVSGIKDSGQSVIERWTFPDNVGRWRHTYTGTANPIGTPTLPYTGSTTINGLYRSLPADWFSPDIDEILETDTYGWIDALTVDPEGRYLLFSADPNREIYRLDLMAPGSPTVQSISGPSSIPDLSSVSALLILDHANLGRVCVVDYPENYDVRKGGTGTEPVVYLIDSDNDGVFESSQTSDLDTHIASFTTSIISATGVITDQYSPWSSPWLGGL